MSDSRRPPRLWIIGGVALAALMFLGGSGVFGACKLLLDCRTAGFFSGPVEASDFAGKGAGNMGLPTDLEVEAVAKGFQYPTDLAFLPDGRLLVAEKDGLVKVVSKEGDSSAPFLDLRTRVSTGFFRGIMNIAVDPDPSKHPYVYVTYAAIGKGAKSTAPTVARVTRFEMNASGADLASEHVIVGTTGILSCLLLPGSADCLPSEVDHVGADIAFAADGTMFVSTGDGGGEEHVEQVALLAQSVDTLGGKVLHIDRNGRGLKGNPYWDGNPRSNRSRVWAVGLRNPFRMTLLEGKESSPLIGDVGWTARERLVFAGRGANLGWPCYEASERTAQYSKTDFCASFYESHPEAPTAPWLDVRHPTGVSITGGVSLAGASALPKRFRSSYVFGDWGRSRISLLPLSTETGGDVNATVLTRRAAGPVSFAVGPDGALYYVAANVGEVRRIAAVSN